MHIQARPVAVAKRPSQVPVCGCSFVFLTILTQVRRLCSVIWYDIARTLSLWAQNRIYLLQVVTVGGQVGDQISHSSILFIPFLALISFRFVSFRFGSCHSNIVKIQANIMLTFSSSRTTTSGSAYTNNALFPTAHDARLISRQRLQLVIGIDDSDSS